MRDVLRRSARRSDIPVDLWVTCRKCGAMHYRPEFEAGLSVCPKCNYHDRLAVAQRLALLLDDPASFSEIEADLTAADPLEFRRPNGAYPERVARARISTGRNEAVVCGTGRLDGRLIAIGVMEFGFIAGSMGAATGEKIARLFEFARLRRLPLLMVTASGGARQDEGLFALMQMAKTVAAATRLSAASVPYICLMADPTLAGVTASFASVADVIIGEPGATIRFAGTRVVQGALGRRKPVEDHTAEWVLRRGMIDMVVPRHTQKAAVSRLVDLLMAPRGAGRRPAAATTPSSELRVAT